MYGLKDMWFIALMILEERERELEMIRLDLENDSDQYIAKRFPKVR